MASKVFLHIGLPKTGTTYLQTVMWADRDRMRAQGVLLPGRERRDHLWTTRIVREDPNLATYEERVRESPPDATHGSLLHLCHCATNRAVVRCPGRPSLPDVSTCCSSR
jgi:superfamily II DNA helicase RecQ